MLRLELGDGEGWRERLCPMAEVYVSCSAQGGTARRANGDLSSPPNVHTKTHVCTHKHVHTLAPALWGSQETRQTGGSSEFQLELTGFAELLIW